MVERSIGKLTCHKQRVKEERRIVMCSLYLSLPFLLSGVDTGVVVRSVALLGIHLYTGFTTYYIGDHGEILQFLCALGCLIYKIRIIIVLTS